MFVGGATESIVYPFLDDTGSCLFRYDPRGSYREPSSHVSLCNSGMAGTPSGVTYVQGPSNVTVPRFVAASSSGVDFGVPAQFNAVKELSIVAVARWGATGQDMQVVSKYGSVSSGEQLFEFRSRFSDNLRVAFYYTNPDSVSLTSTTSVTDGAYRALGGSFNSAGSYLMIDGRVESTGVGGVARQNSAAKLYLGRADSAASPLYLTGNIAYVAIFGRYMTPTEMSQAMYDLHQSLGF